MIVGGLSAGNPVTRIMVRALVGLAGGYLLGAVVGWIGSSIVNDQIERTTGDDAASLRPAEKIGGPEPSTARS